MKARIVASSIVVAAAVAFGCSSDSKKADEYRAARDKARLSLSDSIGVAEKASQSKALRASIVVGSEKAYAVTTVAGTTYNAVRVDSVDGKVLSTTATGQDKDCPDASPIAQAIATAEKEKSGTAVAIQPDDDDACNREVKVLAGSTLWEIKVDRSGKVVEVEEDDGESED